MSRGKKRKVSLPQVFFGVMFDISITVVIILASFIAYVAFFTTWQANKAQAHMSTDLKTQWSEKAPSTALDPQENVDPLAARRANYEHIISAREGDPVAILTMPEIRGQETYVIVKGTNLEDITVGPGWYTDTQLPGEVGNFAVAGHEYGYGAAFERLWDYAATCSPVEIETQDKIFTYRMLPTDVNSPQEMEKFRNCSSSEIFSAWEKTYKPQGVGAVDTVSPTFYDIMAPIPGDNHSWRDSGFVGADGHRVEPTLPLITLQTCYPHFGNSERAVVRAVLTHTEDKNTGEIASTTPALTSAEKEEQAIAEKIYSALPKIATNRTKNSPL